jgi:NifU-like protein involved in Fe-S cluster formation
MTTGSEQLSAEYYSALLIDHFERPRNAGALDNADVETYVTNPVCGDSLRLFLRIDEDGARIEAASFLSSGCPASIATSSVATELITGMALDDAVALTREHYTEAVGGLPRSKVHCSVLAAAAVRNSIEAYRQERQDRLQGEQATA